MATSAPLALSSAQASIDVVDGEAHMLEAVVGKGRRGSHRIGGMRGGDQHGLAADAHADALLAGIKRAGADRCRA